jgi:hypothetical protein
MLAPHLSPLTVSPHAQPMTYSGPPLTDEEQYLLEYLWARRAQRMPDEPSTELSTLLARGVLFLRPSIIGPVVSLGYSGCKLLGVDAFHIPTTDRSADLIYFQEALNLAEESGYEVQKVETTGRARLTLGVRRHLLLARATQGGYATSTVSAHLARKSVISSREGTVILVAPDTAPYARLLSRHPQLQVWPRALRPPPTTAHTTPSPPGTAEQSGPL